MCEAKGTDREKIPFGITGANYAAAPFIHINPDGSRFRDESFGILYLADISETAIAETRYHRNKYFRNVEGLPYDSVDMRCLKVNFSAKLIDTVSIDDIHVPDDHTTSRIFGYRVKESEEARLQYRSVRNVDFICWGLMLSFTCSVYVSNTAL